MLTLSEILKDTKGIVRIGCKSGSGYFFCSDAADKDIYDVIAEASDADLHRLEQHLASSKRNYAKLVAMAESEKSKKKRKGYEAKARRQKKNIFDTEVKINLFKPFIDREVIEYGKTPISCTQYILIEGETQGSYWFEEEYRKGRACQKKNTKKSKRS